MQWYSHAIQTPPTKKSKLGFSHDNYLSQTPSQVVQPANMYLEVADQKTLP